MGYVYYLNGAEISWSSKKAKTVVVSLAKVEYVTLSNILEQAIQIKKFINNFQALDRINIVPMLSDNTSSIKMTKSNEFYRQIKYIDIQHHFIRELLERNKIFINYINTKDMLVDNFIKALRKPKFENHQVRLGITLIKEDVIVKIEG